MPDVNEMSLPVKRKVSGTDDAVEIDGPREAERNIVSLRKSLEIC